MHIQENEQVRQAALRPILSPGRLWYPLAGFLAALVVFGLVGYALQLKEGLGVTGLSQRVSWGFYISNLVFFIGISYGGALTSAILRLTGAGWRAPLTRLAESMAVAALLVGAVFPLVDLGRPDRFMNILLHGQVGSPVAWDVGAISTYLAASMIFLYLPLIPDIAVLRDRLGPTAGRLRRRVYTLLSLGWNGSEQQQTILNRSMTVIAILIIPLAVSVHSVLAWLFGVTSRPGWDSTIFAPYFVLGAMFSGVGMVILVLAGFRWAYGLQRYITIKHFRYLGYILLVLAAGYLYFMVSEYLTEGYKLHGENAELLDLLFLGKLAPFFWFFGVGGILLPIALIAFKGTRNIWGICIAAAAAVAGMWLKRFLIVVPGLAEPMMPRDVVIYWPSWVEIAITIAGAAAIPLMLMLFTRFFPVMSIYEMEEFGESEESQAVPAVAAAAAN